MGEQVGSLEVDLSANTAKFTDGLNKAVRHTEKVSQDITKYIKIGATAVAAMTTAAAVMTKQFIDQADQAGELANKLGITTESLSKLRYASEMSGVQLGTMESALAAMIRRTDDFKDGGGAAAKSLQMLGFNAEYAQKHFTSADTTFALIAERLSRLEPGIQKTAIAQDIFSKSATGMINLVDQGAAGLQNLYKEAERTGNVISGNTANAAGEFNDQMDRLTKRLNGVALSIVSDVLPDLNKLSDALGKYAKYDDDVSAIGESFKWIAQSSVVAFATIDTGFTQLGARAENVFLRITGAWDKFLLEMAKSAKSSLFESIADSIGATDENIKKLTASTLKNDQEINKTAERYLKAEIALEELVKEIYDGIEKVNDKVKESNPKVKIGATLVNNDLKKVEDQIRKWEENYKRSEAIGFVDYYSLDEIAKNKFAIANEPAAQRQLAEAYAKAVKDGLESAETDDALTDFSEQMKDGLHSSLQNGIQDALNGDFSLDNLASTVKGAMSSAIASSMATQMMASSGMATAAGTLTDGGWMAAAGLAAFSLLGGSSGTPQKTEMEKASEYIEAFSKSIREATDRLDELGQSGNSIVKTINDLRGEVNTAQTAGHTIDFGAADPLAEYNANQAKAEQFSEDLSSAILKAANSSTFTQLASINSEIQGNTNFNDDLLANAKSTLGSILPGGFGYKISDETKIKTLLKGIEIDTLKVREITTELKTLDETTEAGAARISELETELSNFFDETTDTLVIAENFSDEINLVAQSFLDAGEAASSLTDDVSHYIGTLTDEMNSAASAYNAFTSVSSQAQGFRDTISAATSSPVDNVNYLAERYAAEKSDMDKAFSAYMADQANVGLLAKYEKEAGEYFGVAGSYKDAITAAYASTDTAQGMLGMIDEDMAGIQAVVDPQITRLDKLIQDNQTIIDLLGQINEKEYAPTLKLTDLIDTTTNTIKVSAG